MFSNIFERIFGNNAIYYNRGLTKYNLRQYAEAIQDFSEAIRLKPDEAEAYYNCGLAKNNLGQYAEAIQDYSVAIRLKPDFAFAYYNRGLAKYNLRQYAEAIQDFSEAIRLKPDYVEAYYNRGAAKHNFGQYAEAIQDFSEAIRLKPDYVEAYYNRGTAKHNLGQYAEAIQDYSEIIRLKPDAVLAYYNRGTAKHNLGQYAEAIQDYSEIIRLKPDYVKAYYNRGAAKHNLGQYAEAIQDYSEVIRLKPDYVEAYYNRGAAYEKSGRAQDAQNDRLQAKIIEHRNNPKKHLYDAIAKGQKKVALECLENLLKENKDPYPLTFSNAGIQEYALLTLARFGHAEWLGYFLKSTPIHITDEQNNTALHIAAQYGHQAFCETLIKEGIREKKEDDDYCWPINELGQTPVHSAAIGGHAELIKFFIKQYAAEQTLQAPATNGDTFVHLLARNRHAKSLHILLETFPYLSVKTLNHHGHDALMEAISVRDEAVVSELLQHHIDLANRDHDGRTTLHLAVCSNQLSLVKLLVEKGASLTLRDKKGKTPGDYAVRNNQIDVYLTNYTAKNRSRKHFSQQRPSYHNLVFQGGSIKGLAYPSALRTLEKEDICKLTDIRRVGGTSAGAITALLVALNYSFDEIDHLMDVKKLVGCDLPQMSFSGFLDGEYGQVILAAAKHDWKTVLGEDNHAILERLSAINSKWSALRSFLRSLSDGTASKGISLAFKLKKELLDVYRECSTDYDLCPGETLRGLFDTLIRRKLSEKSGIKVTTEVTFAELSEHSDFKAMYFVGVNLATGEHEVFSFETTPTMVVADAVRISMSIPMVFNPHPKVTKENGRLKKTKDLYVDGGVLWNYPVELFDFVRYEQDKTLDDDSPKINHETLGLRLVSSKQKARYENPLSEGQTIDTNSAGKLWEHIKSLFEIIANNQQESSHTRQGDAFRSIYIDVLTIGMLDFDKVEDPLVKKALIQQGQEAVLDFKERMKIDLSHQVQLPERLEKKILEHSKILSHQVQKGSQQMMSQFRLNPHPELVLAFYGYADTRLHHYLHQMLGVSLWARDNDGNTAYHLAVQRKDKEALKRLLAVAPKQDIEDTNYKQETPLIIAERNQDAIIVSILKEESLDNIYVKQVIGAASSSPNSSSSYQMVHTQSPKDTDDKEKKEYQFLTEYRNYIAGSSGTNHENNMNLPIKKQILNSAHNSSNNNSNTQDNLNPNVYQTGSTNFSNFLLNYNSQLSSNNNIQGNINSTLYQYNSITPSHTHPNLPTQEQIQDYAKTHRTPVRFDIPVGVVVQENPKAKIENNKMSNMGKS